MVQVRHDPGRRRVVPSVGPRVFRTHRRERLHGIGRCIVIRVQIDVQDVQVRVDLRLRVYKERRGNKKYVVLVGIVRGRSGGDRGRDRKKDIIDERSHLVDGIRSHEQRIY